MKKIDSFTNLYSLSKTLCFSLIPQGKTEENFNSRELLKEDEDRAKAYEIVKGYMDDFHRDYIDKQLSNFVFDETKVSIAEYAALFEKPNKSSAETKRMTDIEDKLREQISKFLTNTETYKKLDKKEFIREMLPEYLNSDEEKAYVQQFDNFSTYFSGFWMNRKNMYSKDAQSTAIAYRCINDNLPKFLNNCYVFEKIKNILADNITALNNDSINLSGITIENMFTTDYFFRVLSQSGIDRYNEIIGGYSNSDGSKVKGINEYINLYNQQVAKSDKSLRLPRMVQLYKQILSETSTVSFLPEKFESDDALIKDVADFYSQNIADTISDTAEISLPKLFSSFTDFDTNAIYIKSGLPITDISNAVFGSWNVISDSWRSEYQKNNPIRGRTSFDAYKEKMDKAYKSIDSFTLSEIQRLGGNSGNVVEYVKNSVKEKVSAIYSAYSNAIPLFSNNYPTDEKLINDEKSIEIIKNLLDSIKELERFLKPLLGTGKEENRDMVFYGCFMPLYESIALVDKLYDKVRNYVTQKPYSKDKIKLNFDNPQFLGGWDKNKEKDYRAVILKKDENYYLAIMDKDHKNVFMDSEYHYSGGDHYEKIEYKLLPGPNKMLPKVFFAASNIDYYAPSDEILSIRKKESFKKGENFSISDCHKFIDFFKASINKHPDWKEFGFKFTPTNEYNDISEFYNEVKEQGYSIRYKNVPTEYINDLVDNGHIYLFRIYNKDFSKYSHGIPNMHTLYFREIFDQKNLDNVVFKLNGEAEMFYRKASIKEKDIIRHPANHPIKNKNPQNSKSESLFEYDLIKDKRFTKRQFSIHIPITMNFKAEGREFINYDIRKALRESGKTNVIGIDRGERNLIYISVINSDGKIILQKSLNEIVYNGNGFENKVNYQKLLDEKEKERDLARKNWKSIENIKELKEGYLSAVVNEICKLVVEYDAIIVMENLNFGFKRGRFKVEKQVYQKFENMLISKLNFLTDKKLPADEIGGLLNAYQLTNKVNGISRGTQNGIIFYIPAYLTSKIDPTTGFVDLLHPKYVSTEASSAFFSRFDDIRYNEKTDMFEFSFDYSNFDGCAASYRKKWIVCTNADRIRTFRNKEKNNEWDNETVILTEEFKKLFDEYRIDYKNDLKTQIVKKNDKSFMESLISLVRLTLQMRNSITGNVDVDYLISPVRNSDGEFYDSRKYSGSNAVHPTDADANGAYNIARKGLWAVEQIRNAADDEFEKCNIAISNSQWLEFAQKTT